MTDLSMQYLGMKLSGPIVVASSPLSQSIENVRHMEDAGAAAIVLSSLFEEQLAIESRALDEDLSRGTDSFAESLGYLPDLDDYHMSHEVYLEHLRKARAAVGIPVLGSLNGATSGGWVRLAREMEQAGAYAIELNTFALATDKTQTSAAVEEQLIGLVRSVCQSVKIPVAVKLSPSFTSIPNLPPSLSRPAQRRSSFSTASISPISTLKLSKCGLRCISPRRLSCCRACTGRQFSTATSTWTSPSPAEFIRLKTCSRA